MNNINDFIVVLMMTIGAIVITGLCWFGAAAIAVILHKICKKWG